MERLFGTALRWSVASQERARRNAMVACTELAARRHERIEVDHYIRGALARRAG